MKTTAHLKMTRRTLLGGAAAFGALPLLLSAQEKAAKKYQARAPKTEPFGAEAFKSAHDTTIRWLGGAGFFINTRGTILMLDPLLEGFDMPILIDMPILPKDVPRVDAVLVTHSDNDHYSIPTCRDLKPVCHSYRSTTYVASLMKKEGLPTFGYDIGDVFKVGHARIKTTPADHDWQNAFPQPGVRHFDKKDCCGFWMETPDGSIWAPGDSRLMPQHLQMPQMDAMLFDYSEDSQFHFGLENSVKLANAYPNTPLLLGHWGTVDAPDFAPFNGDPQHLTALVVNPGRVRILAPGQAFRLERVHKA